MLRALLVVLVLGLGVAAFAGYVLFQRFDAPGPAAADTRILIERGQSVAGVAAMLEGQGVLQEALPFRILARLENKAAALKVGEYMAPAGASPRQILTLLTEGPAIVRRFTVPEGATTAEALKIVAAAEGLTGPLPEGVPEGALLPETYHYAWGDTRQAAVARMAKAMEAALAEALAVLPADHPLKTAEELATLASIVEKETALAAERPRVAAVFVNRLRRGMLLQSDPTTIYAVTRGQTKLGRPLTYADLRRDDPYNTYVAPGLPPGPIASPGRASLMAAANPPETDEFYFVADGTGGHAFARTLNEHNRNVRAWRRIERERGLR